MSLYLKSFITPSHSTLLSRLLVHRREGTRSFLILLSMLLIWMFSNDEKATTLIIEALLVCYAVIQVQTFKTPFYWRDVTALIFIGSHIALYYQLGLLSISLLVLSILLALCGAALKSSTHT